VAGDGRQGNLFLRCGQQVGGAQGGAGESWFVPLHINSDVDGLSRVNTYVSIIIFSGKGGNDGRAMW